MNRPKAIDKIKDDEVLNYISALEGIVEGIQKDTNTRLYYAISKHLPECLKKIEELTMDGEDEDMSRLTKYTEQAMKIEENLAKLRDKIIPEELRELEERDEESVEKHVMG